MKRLVAALVVWLVVVGGAGASPWPSSCITSITAGQTISGTLTTSDCYFYFNSSPSAYYYTDVYSFSGTQGQQIAITMNSTAVDAWLDLYNVNEVSASALVSDDDGGGGTNSRIPAGTGYYTLPATGTYYIWANTAISNQTGPYTITLTAAGGTPPPPATLPGEVTVTEFYHPGFDHYFITAYPAETASLAAGGLPPWVATGKTFKVWDGPGASISKVWRFFSASFAPKSSHFYTNNPTEAQGLINGHAWTMEADNAFYMMTSPTGTCPSGTIPLYRLYNESAGGAPNHRYTIDPAVRSQMIAAHWTPEGNGADGVFACVPLSTSIPPPTGSQFQQDVMYYTNTILGFASGNVVDLDQLSLVLGAGVNALLTTGSTCPSASSVPPLTNLTTLPPTLTLTFDFGSGCTVTGDTGSATVAGRLVVALNNLVFTETHVAGSVSITMTNVKVNGTLVANGMATATFNVTVNSSAATPTYAGTITVSLNSLQLPNGIGMNGTATITLNSAGTTLLSTDLTTTPSNLVIRLNGLAFATQADGSVVVNTTAASTVGAYSVTVSNVRIDPAKCTTGAVAGTVSFTKGGQTGTVTFNSTCNYAYTGP